MSAPSASDAMTALLTGRRRGRCGIRGGLTVVLAAMGVAAGLRASDMGPVEGKLVTLPPYIVEENGRHLDWGYLELPGFELLTVCSRRGSEDFVRRYWRLNQMLAQVLPEKFQAKSSVPDIQILFNEELGHARSQEVMAAMLRRDGVAMGPDGTPAAAPAFGATQALTVPTVAFLPNLRMWDLDTTAVFAAVRESERLQFTFAADHIAFLLEHRVPALPDWLVEGMEGFCEQIDFGDDEISVRPAVWATEAETKALADDADRPRALWPMQELLAGRRAKEGAGTGERAQVWRAQCALFVRWAIVERRGARAAGLWQLVGRLEKEPLSERLFRECLGLGFADVRDRLSDYLPRAVQERATLPAVRYREAPPLKLREATPGEVARLRGDWERMEIAYVRKAFPELVGKYVAQARHTLQRGVDLGDRDPRLPGVLGLLESDAGNAAVAREDLEAAAKGGVVRPRVYLELAKLRYKEAMAAAADGKLRASQVAAVLGPLRAMRSMAPPLPESYALMTDVWSHSVMAPTGAELAWLNEGVGYFPEFSTLVLRTIYLNAHNGLIAPIEGLAEAGWIHASDPAIRARFEVIRKKLRTAEPAK